MGCLIRPGNTGGQTMQGCSPRALDTFRSHALATIFQPRPEVSAGRFREAHVSLLNQTNFLPGLHRPAGKTGSRRLEIARHADGTDALGWILLGFLLGAAAAVATMMHAELPRSAAAAQPPAAGRLAYIAPSPARSAPAMAAATIASRAPVSPHTVLAAPASPPASEAGPDTPAKAAPAAVDEQVAEDAAAAGMTSRRGAPARPAGDQGLY